MLRERRHALQFQPGPHRQSGRGEGAASRQIDADGLGKRERPSARDGVVCRLCRMRAVSRTRGQHDECARQTAHDDAPDPPHLTAGRTP
jgi:hypothetical protein